jgi:hypothetical protein
VVVCSGGLGSAVAEHFGLVEGCECLSNRETTKDGKLYYFFFSVFSPSSSPQSWAKLLKPAKN